MSRGNQREETETNEERQGVEGSRRQKEMERRIAVGRVHHSV